MTQKLNNFAISSLVYKFRVDIEAVSRKLLSALPTILVESRAERKGGATLSRQSSALTTTVCEVTMTDSRKSKAVARDIACRESG